MRILVVDDEKIERNGIRFLLKQQKIEAEVIEAVNGVKALETLEKEKVDILLTDIKMPFMDGMQLIEEAAPKYPDMKIIIYSGFGEFEYAKKAMKHGVKDYILKPVDPEEFAKTMNRVIQEIVVASEKKDLHEKSQNFIREHILLSIFNGIDGEEIGKVSENLISLDFLDEYHYMIMMEFSNDFFGKKGDGFIESIGESIVEPFDYLNMNPQQSVFLFMGEKLPMKDIAESLSSTVRNVFGEKCYLTVSDYWSGREHLAEKYDTLESLMDNKFYLLDENCFYEKSSDSEDKEFTEDDTLLKLMKQDITMKDMAGLRNHFEQLCDKYKGEKGFSQVYVKFIFSNLMKEIYDCLPAQTGCQLDEAVDQLYRTTEFSQVMEIVDDGIKKLEEMFSVNPQMEHREIETVKEYIYSHYDQELSVDMLAEQVFMAPSYLSHIFKKETGQNLSKFIKALRMEKAKEMLLKSHNKIVNISYAVGYPNVSYFCQSFREYYGISPQKYRDQGETNEIH